MSGRADEVVRIRDGIGPEETGESIEAFLHHLAGPTLFRIPGTDRSRTRAVVTLLHGNEPSGARALRALVGRGIRPVVDLVCFVGAVQAALAAPGFAHRTLPGCRDLNRCFLPPFEGVEGRVAEIVLSEMRRARPEAMIDLHNTSGAGPSYGVSTRVDPERLALTSLFTGHLILTDLRLGSVMEAFANDWPTVTVECGGASDPAADAAALAGLERFATRGNVLGDIGTPPPVVLERPLRLELAETARVAYEQEPAPGADVTLRRDIDHLSFRVVPRGERLGWTTGLDALRVRTADAVTPAARFFTIQGDALATRVALRIFMVTTNPAIALADCLFYFIPDEGA